MTAADTIVIGIGGMGSAACYALAKRGADVIGIEQFTTAHDRGSSHGETRVIRHAYFEHPGYIPLVNKSYELWEELEEETKRSLACHCGLLTAGTPGSALISGLERCASEHPITLEEVGISEFSERFPGFRVNREMKVLFEKSGGFLRVEACVESHCRMAMHYGAKLHFEEQAISWVADNDCVHVETKRESYQCRNLVVCGGPWSSALLADLGLPLEVRRSVAVWYETANTAHSLDCRCPVFGFDTPAGFFYGFPAIDSRGMKIAEHEGKELLRDPARLEKRLLDSDRKRLEEFAKLFLPGLTNRVAAHSACMYTLTPDRHFIIDRHPEHPNVFFAAGFSGHGFKFAPIVGSIMADYATGEKHVEAADFLSLSRFGLDKGGAGETIKSRP